MHKLLSVSALAAVLTIAAAASANAWTRYGTIYGPRGVSTVQGSGSCAGGTCSRSVTRTGPYGYSYNRSGSVTCGGGTCSGSRTTTGPYGGTITRQGSVSRY